VPFELRPSLPEEGVSLGEVGAAHSDRVNDHLFKVARQNGVPFMLVDRVPNTHLALAMSEFARDLGPERYQQVHEAIFRAYQGEGRDIGSRSVLLEIARDAGIDEEELEAAWDQERYDGRLHAFRHYGLEVGVRATPSALICDELLVGFRPYAVLEAALRRCLAGDANAGDTVAPGEESDSATAGYTPAEGEPPSITAR
jgi:predicted DsbA family dithiol-disulfide isomerase